MQIFNPVGDWPNSINFLTNYGVMKFDFPVDLTSEDEINKMGKLKAFKPTYSGLIYMEYKIYNGEVA